MKKLILASALLALVGAAFAYVPMGTYPQFYTQDFNTLISSGSMPWVNDNTLPDWFAERTGSSPTTFNIQADDGTTATNILFSYGTANALDRALGTRGGRNFAYGVLLRNTSPYVITDITVSYFGEQWRDSDAQAQTVHFAYQIAASPFSALDPLDFTNWTVFPLLDFTSPQFTSWSGPIDGNLPANRVYKTALIAGLNLPAGQYIMLKWDDPNYGGNDHDLGIDDVEIMWHFGGQVPVELSSFTATISAENFVNLAWISQSETNLAGYYLYRAADKDPANAELISPLIPATNSGSEQVYSFTDSELDANGQHYYWLQSIELDGSDSFHGPVSVYFNTNNEYSIPGIPLATELKAVYPNPFNPQVLIPYSLAGNLPVGIRIFNSRGQLQRQFDLGVKQAGNYQLAWDGTDLQGRPAASGVYYIVMNAGKDSYTRKAVLMK